MSEINIDYSSIAESVVIAQMAIDEKERSDGVVKTTVDELLEYRESVVRETVRELADAGVLNDVQ